MSSDAVVVEVGREPWGFSIRSPNRDLNVTGLWRALIETRNDAVRLGLAATEGVVDLHGAVLVRDDAALLLLGEEWAGKTTLALELVDIGWRYFSDDLVVLERETGLVRPVPKPPGIKARSWDAMRRYWGPLPAGLEPPDGSFVIPPPFTGSLDERARPRWLVSLRYEEGEASIGALSPGETLWHAAKHLGTAGADELTALHSAFAGCRAFSLAYSDTSTALKELEGLVR